ncbi:MAG: hypothetical protein HY903_17855 [Deltaproteobacteria bacterium]|nr:hypothetical protein [Deltaproteobacteria bacterium]
MTGLLPRLLRPEPAMNALRYANAPGHVESYFIRANDPERRRALWLKVTIFAPRVGAPVAQTWLIWFDGEDHRTLARKDTHPLALEGFAGVEESIAINVGTFAWSLGARGAAHGHVATDTGGVDFDLHWQTPATPVAGGLSLYPLRLLREGPLPRFKVNTPSPCLELRGTIRLADQEISLDGWTGSQGHNWGSEHYFQYGWGQCSFPATANAPAGFVEGGVGRVKLGPLVSPPLAVMVVRYGERELRFDTVLDLWRQEATFAPDRLVLRLRNRAATVRLRLDASDRPMVQLGYPNPDGTLTYCLNSKLARVLLEVQPRGEAPFTLRSAHGGALELLGRNLDPRFAVV